MNQVILGGMLLLAVYLISMLIFVEHKQDTTLANFTWGGGCLLIAWYTFFTVALPTARQWLVTLLITLWSIRLIIYLYSRYKKDADPRFVAWQKRWGRYALALNSAWIFGPELLFLLVMASPIVAINSSSAQGLNVLDILGLFVWVVGFVLESISDYQLSIFMKNPENKGKIMTDGIWHYSRHPNYFGEMLMWWGIYLIALSVPLGVFTIVAPLAITITLRYVTGVPLLESVFAGNPEYQQYKRTTNMLIPWWPQQ